MKCFLFDKITQFMNKRSSFSDPSHFDVDPDPDPGIHILEKWIRIHLSVIVDPDPRIHIWKKWIRIRFQSGSGSEYLFFIFFIKKFMSDKLKCLFLLPPKFRKGISQITKTFSFTFTLHSFWCYPDLNQCFVK